MKYTQRSERASILTSRMSTFMRETFCLDEGVPILAGLPVGSTLHERAKMVLANSCCTYNLFEDPMLSVSQHRDCDVVLVRHGLHPESFDDVLVDVAVRVSFDRLLLRDLRMFLGEGGDAWLVPDKMAPYLKVGPDGVSLSFEAPFQTFCQRSDGLNRAARKIVYAARGREMTDG